MIADRLFEEGTVPEWTTAAFYRDREVAPHLEQQGHRERLHLAAKMLKKVVHGRTVSDLGAGDGGLLSILNGATRRWGYDLAPVNNEAALRRGIIVETIDIVDEWPLVECGDIVIVTEILEHLVDPHTLLRRIHESGAQYLMASSPYTEFKGSAYELHTWAWDREGYEQMLRDTGWTVLQSDTAWICQCVLAVRA